MNSGKIALIVMSFLLVGCQTTGNQTEFKWHVSNKIDPFDDSSKCQISTWNIKQGNSFAWRTANAIYPLVEIRKGEISIGLTRPPITIGNTKTFIPIGTAQMRIDGMASWTIFPSETKIEGEIDNSYMQDLSKVMKGNPNINQEAYAQMMKNTQMSAHQLMSPSTMASGSKAIAILDQMKSGTNLIFRQSSANIKSDPNKISLAGFGEALKKCGI
ncbi:hypothetical protein A9Q83_09625 [Alphaproteobacteria bacterium 46_93_T64]|nr:hypothetical protein A9Q83_09625 [Alphaproteobacteria bacterium 46_93_T64]